MGVVIVAVGVYKISGSIDSLASYFCINKVPLVFVNVTDHGKIHYITITTYSYFIVETIIAEVE